MSDSSTYFVGIDWGRKSHQFCVLNDDGQAVKEQTCQHQPEPIRQMALWLLQLVNQQVGRLKIGLETPTGPLVLALQSFGLTLWSINPKQSSRFRDRFSVAGAKDDRRDAKVIASALRTDPQAFRKAPELTKEQLKLRSLMHCTERMVQQKVKLTHQLNELTAACFPALLDTVEDVAQSWFLSLLLQAPTPHQAQCMTRSALQKLLRDHRIRRFDAVDLLPVLRQQPFPGVDPIDPPQAIEIAALAQQLQLLLSQIKDIERQMDAVIENWCQAPSHETDSDRFSDAQIIRSMPGVGRNVSSVLLSEAPQAIEQRDYQALRALSGVAPVTQSSGNKTVVRQRRAVNQLMQNALYHCARVASQRDAICKRKYYDLKARGKTHGQALRCVGDRLLKVLCTMLENNTLYEPVQLETDADA